MRRAAFLRAVNVGGTGKLPMADLRALADGLGWTRVETLLASGNLIFQADGADADVARTLEEGLAAMGLTTEVYVRDAATLARLVAANPFPTAPGNQVAVLFGPAGTAPGAVRHQQDEEIAEAEGHIFIHHPSGMGRSKLVLTGVKACTARNLNTLTKVAALTAQP